MVLVTPADAKTKVPVLMMFGRFGAMPVIRDAGRAGATGAIAAGLRTDSAQQLIAAGWGYATISPASIQADNGAGLTRGIIGLVNKGQPRKPDDWGSLRAWAWGASRGLDYLETDPALDRKHVGIEGVSRYGKAALVAARVRTALRRWRSSDHPVKAAPSCTAATSVKRSRTSPAPANITGWPATS